MSTDHEILAVRYAHLERCSHENFHGGDSHDVPMPLDYFVWIVRGGGRSFVVDTGFGPDMAQKRGRTGRSMCHQAVNATFEAGDVVAMVRRVFAGRVVFHDGDSEIASGLSVHRLGGHSRGLQVVRVRTNDSHRGSGHP
jgi:glyoxylase-like metal-dependent hydrolase (beta-lactamase superfamily II)